MSYDIEKALAYQIKKEIAQRYFRLRKLIEDDSANVQQMLQRLNETYQSQIKPAFFKIYGLLASKDLIEKFSNILGLETPPFLEEFLKNNDLERPILPQDLDRRGWFKESRFTNLLLDAYEELFKKWQDYNDQREEVLEELDIVKEEVEQFTRNYSLDEIMHFLRTLNMEDETTSKTLGRTIEGRKLGELDKKLSFSRDIKELYKQVPDLETIPEPKNIKNQLERLAHEAYSRHKEKLDDL
ncbi:MAG: hypothetical protein GXO58_10020 [Thermodesulfobacteria bacterium]|nr:hypothetical protein [Thermodesulfobacteriota bacterium]